MLKACYSFFRFVFEVLCLVIAGCWGFTNDKLGSWRVLAGVFAPLAIIVVWGVWGAPNAHNRLQGNARLVLELSIYAVCAVFLYNTNYRGFATGFVIFGLLNACINHFTKWLI